MRLLISEVLQKAHNAKTKAQKIKILRENDSQTLRSIFIINYDDSLQCLLPEGTPPFKENDFIEVLEKLNKKKCFNKTRFI